MDEDNLGKFYLNVTRSSAPKKRPKKSILKNRKRKPVEKMITSIDQKADEVVQKSPEPSSTEVQTSKAYFYRLLADRFKQVDNSDPLSNKMTKIEKKLDELNRNFKAGGAIKQRRSNKTLRDDSMFGQREKENNTKPVKKEAMRLQNLFKVFNPFNFIHDLDEQRRYKEELMLQKMDPVSREIYLKKKKFKEKEAKLKAKKNYDVKMLREKHKLAKERMRAHEKKIKELEKKKRQELELAKKGEFASMNDAVGDNKSKKASGGSRIDEEIKSQSKKPSTLPPISLGSSLKSLRRSKKSSRRKSSVKNKKSDARSRKSRYSISNSQNLNNAANQPKFMFKGENGMVIGTIEEYNIQRKADEERRREKRRKRREARREKEKERREMEEKMLEDLMEKANEMFNTNGNPPPEPTYHHKSQREGTKETQREEPTESEDSYKVYKDKNRGVDNYRFDFPGH